MMAGKAGRGSDQFMIRLPDGMRDRIKAAAEKHGRSMNAEVVYALEVYFRLDGLNPDLEGNSSPAGLDAEQAEKLKADSEKVMDGIRAARRLLYKLEALEQAISPKSGPPHARAGEG